MVAQQEWPWGYVEERERGGVSLFARVTEQPVCIFYIQLSPIQGTILDLIMYVHIFKATTHRYTHGVNEV